ncbi:hypothetical protein COB55_00020 [Candidatus Wolfebacteria bacterium]|nr:MAG: hypothetical protein COB55_00020 [Candidatus Wolfebacteria bacterium]
MEPSIRALRFLALVSVDRPHILPEFLEELNSLEFRKTGNIMPAYHRAIKRNVQEQKRQKTLLEASTICMNSK